MGYVNDFGSVVGGNYGDVKGVLDVVLAADYDAFVRAETGTCGDKVTADDVFLHAYEVVDLAVDGSFVEHFGRFLEGCGRHERRSLESGAGDTLKDLFGGCGLGIAYLDRTEVTALER